MYFFRLRALKAELSAGPLPARRALPYVATLAVLVAATASALPFFGGGTSNLWDSVDFLVVVTSAGIGVIVAYRANGGSHGTDFATRLIALGWVVGLRLLPLLPLLYFLQLVTEPDRVLVDYPPATPFRSVILAVYQFVFYWRVAAHLLDVARPRAAPNVAA